ncbi:unnamed protein product [Umbelopsis vinacea]
MGPSQTNSNQTNSHPLSQPLQRDPHHRRTSANQIDSEAQLMATRALRQSSILSTLAIGPPSRDHWKSANFNPHGDLVRGCDTCARQQQKWLAIMRRASLVAAAGSKQEESTNEVVEPPNSSPEIERPKRANIMTNLPPQDMEGISELGREDIVKPQQEPSEQPINIRQRVADPTFNPIASVPADWQWSTF